MGDHLSAKAKLWCWAGVLVDSVVFLLAGVTKRTGSPSLFHSKTLLWL